MRAVLVTASVAFSAAAAHAQAAPRWAAAVDSMMALEIAATRTPGAQIAVVERGRRVYTKGYGVADAETGRPVTERTLFQTGSVTKLFTGVLLAQLASANVVDLRAPISRYVTEQAGREVGAATAHALLTHSAGWGHSGGFGDRADDAALGDTFRAVGDTIVVPGTAGLFSFSNPGFSMAGYVAERAARRPFAVLLDSVVLRPLGMTRSTLRPLLAMTHDFALGHATPPGRAATVVRPMPTNSTHWPSGFLFTSAAETARLATALMDGGTLDGVRVLAPDAVRAVTAAHLPRGVSRVEHVGYGLDVDSVDRLVWRKGGNTLGFRGLVAMWPAERLAVVVLANSVGDLPVRAAAGAARIVGGIAPPPAAASVTEREPTAAERAALLGEYRLNRRAIQIHEANGRLELRRLVYSAPIRMIGADRFVVHPPNGERQEYLVVRDGAGAVRYIYNDDRVHPRVP